MALLQLTLFIQYLAESALETFCWIVLCQKLLSKRVIMMCTYSMCENVRIFHTCISLCVSVYARYREPLLPPAICLVWRKPCKLLALYSSWEPVPDVDSICLLSFACALSLCVCRCVYRTAVRAYNWLRPDCLISLSRCHTDSFPNRITLVTPCGVQQGGPVDGWKEENLHKCDSSY